MRGVSPHDIQQPRWETMNEGFVWVARIKFILLMNSDARTIMQINTDSHVQRQREISWGLKVVFIRLSSEFMTLQGQSLFESAGSHVTTPVLMLCFAQSNTRNTRNGNSSIPDQYIFHLQSDTYFRRKVHTQTYAWKISIGFNHIKPIR